MKTATISIAGRFFGQVTINIKDEETEDDIFEFSSDEIIERMVNKIDFIDNCVDEIELDDVVIDK